MWVSNFRRWSVVKPKSLSQRIIRQFLRLRWCTAIEDQTAGAARTCCRGRCLAARFRSMARTCVPLRRSHPRSTSAESRTIAAQYRKIATDDDWTVTTMTMTKIRSLIEGNLHFFGGGGAIVVAIQSPITLFSILLWVALSIVERAHHSNRNWQSADPILGYLV